MIETLRDLLLDYGLSESVDKKARVEAEIWRQFGAERTVLIWDMSGFSLLTRRHGIVHYLSMVRRMQEVTRPIVRHSTIVIRQSSICGADPNRSAKTGFAINPVFRFPNGGFAGLSG